MTPQHSLHRARVQIMRAAFGPALLVLLLLLPALAQAQTPVPTDTPTTHTVQPGETLSEIAKQHGFTLSQLMRVNGIPNPDAIYVGQELRFPIVDRPPGVVIHVVEPGEALSQIAQLYGVDLRALMRANNIANPDGIVTGQELVIPEPADTPTATAEATAAPDPTQASTDLPTDIPTDVPTDIPTALPTEAPRTGPTTHTVRPGETASEIAKLYGVKLADLLRINGIANANLIRSGAELTIPAPGTPTPVVAGEPQVEMMGEPQVELVTPAAEGAAIAASEPATASEAITAGERITASEAITASENATDVTPAVPAVAVAVPTPAPLPERPAASLNRTYAVVSGDTPQRIALRLGLDVDALRRLNNLAPDDGLRAGATLLLPATDRELRVVTESQQYVVAPGDSLSGIARSVNVKLGDLMTANLISNPNLISVGERLTIPGTEQKGSGPLQRVGPARSGYYYYTVRPGDTLSELAQNFSTTKLALMEYNNLTDEAIVYNGMELRVPYGPPPLPVRLPPTPISGSSFLISLSRQQCWVFSGREVEYAWNCSTGHGQWRTRTGNFAVQSKIENAKSNVWRLDMPFWLGIYDVGAVENGIHGLPVSWKTGRKIWTELIGQPATFGCAMLGDENAETLFNLAYIGMPVHIIQ